MIFFEYAQGKVLFLRIVYVAVTVHQIGLGGPFDQGAESLLAVAQACLGLVAVERHVEHRAQFALGERLEDVTERVALLVRS